MTWKYTDDYYKAYTRDTWNESAPAYGPVRRNLDKFTSDLLRLAQPRAGERVLDVACGDGEPALTVAEKIGPDGRVLGVDLSERMVEAAREHARARKVTNADFRVMDAEKLSLPDEAYDLVTCRFGLQIVTDPDRAIAEILRVLKPGGRVAATVWGPGEKCPAIHVIVGPMLKHAEPDETGYIPTPYEMGGPGELADILRKAGFHGVREQRITHPWTFENEAAYLESTLRGTPIGHSLGEEPEDVQRQVLEETRQNLKAWTLKNGTISLPAECVVVAGTK